MTQAAQADPPGRALPRRQQHHRLERPGGRQPHRVQLVRRTSRRPPSAAKFDFLFLAEGLRLREQNGQIYDLDVVGRPDTFTVLAALAAVTDRLGLTGTINSTFNEPYEVARQFATPGPPVRRAGRAGTSSPRGTRSPARTSAAAASSPQDQRYDRAPRSSCDAASELFDSWHGDEIVADKDTGHASCADADAGPVRRTTTRTSTSRASSTCRAARRAAR